MHDYDRLRIPLIEGFKMLCLLHLFFFFSVFITVTTSKVDHSSTFQSIADGETIGSTGGTLELGFFSPGSSTTRYVGIWYKKISVTTILWVATETHPSLIH
ncbi:putative non-specific serine/threonine protein kinase [Rosa chinensis]|uniref:Putative non-specific serine/threonine protein kinase n=1 Tax=Rosa chinensis TaxID=74649 RepID=A0A2P6REU9_ROSCH|nr:putative non-specific serine/threonine protein kinase [Rosa chinensis]